MKPGRELDALVAETLGLTVLTANDQLCVKREIKGLAPPEWRHVTPLPHYSTRIEDAWPLLELLIEERLDQSVLMLFNPTTNRWSIGSPGRLADQGGWLPALPKLHGPDGETAPHAITLAWLQAKGVEVPS